MVRFGEKIGSGGHTKSPWDVLEAMSFEDSNDAEVTKERLSKKPIDIFVRRIFEMNPDMKDQTSDTLQSYKTQHKKLPFVHITPDRIEYKDGRVVSTGNVVDIKKNGFLPGDSNVGGFLKAGDYYKNVGRSECFGSPEDFLKTYVILMQHYLHHAIRTNHRNSDTDSKQEISEIKPALVFVNGDLKVEHGTDYEDHFILRDGSKPEDVVGVMRINEKIDMNNADSVLDSYTSLLNKLNEISKH